MKEIGNTSINFKVTEDNAVKFSEVFRSIFNIEYNKNVLNELDYTYDIFQEFIDKYEQIDDKIKRIFIEAMCFDEITYLHNMELKRNEEKQLVNSLAGVEIKNTSISYICDKSLKYNNIIISNIKKLHAILMEGIALDRIKAGTFRSKDNIYVGTPVDADTIYVQYYPPLAKYIDEAMSLIITYLNDPELNKKRPNTYLNSDIFEFDKKYALFIQPMIIQALLIIVQAFNDGNSRTARAINYASMLNHTNQIFDKDYELPLLYLSRGYWGFKEQYREFLKDIAINPNSENWNKWFRFCLHSIQAHIDYYDEVINNNQLIKKKKI